MVMKMETEIKAPSAGVIGKIFVKPGDTVTVIIQRKGEKKIIEVKLRNNKGTTEIIDKNKKFSVENEILFMASLSLFLQEPL